MTSSALEKPPSGWVKTRERPIQGISLLVTQIWAIISADLRKLRHDPLEVIMRGIQPALWLVIFGEAMGRLHSMPTGGIPYLTYLAPGILAQSVVFISIFYGLTLIWERDLGLLQKFLTVPIPRWGLILGKMLSSGVRGLSQAIIIMLLALVLGIHFHDDLPVILLVMLVSIMGAVFFAGLSMSIASLVKTRERFMGIGQLMTMPLFFASSALYPVAIMPPWLKVLATVNPLSYMVNALRSLLLFGGSRDLAVDLSVLLLGDLVMLVLCSWLYPRAAA